MRLRGLYAITPEAAQGERLFELVRAALVGGIAVLQYRSKGLDAPQRECEARELAGLCRERAVPFIVNDDLELALAVDADGVHLGREDGDLRSARERLGTKLLGASCYDQLALAQSAVAAGADYIAFGSVFASSTKPQAVRAPLSLFRAARRLGVPLVAIGGIQLANAAQLIGAGADALAVISDVFDAPDVTAQVKRYRQLFGSTMERA